MTEHAPGRSTAALPASDSPRSLDTFVDPRSNALNLVRLVLAGSVMFWHAFELTGSPFPVPALAPLFGTIGVDGFFAISGFLIAGSWLSVPRLLPFLRNRALRIFPAFWVCLVAVACVFAPIGAAVSGRSASAVFSGDHSALRYILENASLSMQFYDVAGTPSGIPVAGAWNGSLWTLRWEFGAYLAVAILGLARLLQRRLFVLLVTVVVWLISIAMMAGYGPDSYYPVTATRLGFMFLLGVVIKLYAERITSRGWLVGVAVGLLAISWWLPDYHVLGGAPLAYLVLWCGGRIRDKRISFQRTDISYGLYIYAFPVQQLLVLLGVGVLTPVLFGVVSLAATVPLALASWVLVERPALRLKARRAPSQPKVGPTPPHRA